jgi:hypothetical protein
LITVSQITIFTSRIARSGWLARPWVTSLRSCQIATPLRVPSTTMMPSATRAHGEKSRKPP